MWSRVEQNTGNCFKVRNKDYTKTKSECSWEKANSSLCSYSIPIIFHCCFRAGCIATTIIGCAVLTGLWKPHSVSCLSRRAWVVLGLSRGTLKPQMRKIHCPLFGKEGWSPSGKGHPSCSWEAVCRNARERHCWSKRNEQDERCPDSERSVRHTPPFSPRPF